MEQPQQYYCKSKLMFINNIIDHHLSSSWEEKAFAEDQHGGINGGCIWPPRSYSCTFCRREFRSAQALGGHMNVHRKDRARLRHSSSSPPSHQHSYQTNDDASTSTTVVASSRVSELSTTQNFSTNQYFVKQQKGSNASSVSVKRPREKVYGICLSDKNDASLVNDNYNLFSSKGAKTEIALVICGSMEDVDLELRLGRRPKVI